METLQELVYRKARELHHKSEVRLRTAGLSDEQNKEMRALSRSNIISFIEMNLKLDRAEAQRIVDCEIIHTLH